MYLNGGPMELKGAIVQADEKPRSAQRRDRTLMLGAQRTFLVV